MAEFKISLGMFGVQDVFAGNPRSLIDVAKAADLIKSAFEEAGRDPLTLNVRAHARINYQENGKANLQESIDSVTDIVAAGATHIEFEVFPFLHDPDDLPLFLEKIVALKSTIG